MNSVSTPTSALDNMNPLPTGTRLQEFVIERTIAVGGFGIVYQAHDTQLHRTVAIKEYMPTSMASRGDAATVSVRSVSFAHDFERGKATFIDEARMLARFKHPALIEVFRFWEQNSTAYMATRFYKGSTLKERLRASPGVPNEAELKLILQPVLDALEHMHQEQVFHRDISPDNIMVLEDGSPVLLDLGAARRLEANNPQSFTVLVKPGYAPLEQYAGDASGLQGPWTDVYGWGASAYFALVGKPPPPAASRVMNDSITKLVELRPVGYSHDFLAAIDAALAVRPDDRPQSIADLKMLLALETPPELIPPTPLQDERVEATHACLEATHDSPESRRDPAKTGSDIGVPDVRVPADTTVVSAPMAFSADRSMGTVTAAPVPTTSRRVIGVAVLVFAAIIAALFWNGEPQTSQQPISSSPNPPNETQVPAQMDGAPVGSRPSLATSTLPDAVTAGENAATAGAIEKPASVRFLIKPWGEIYINGENRGVSPPLKALNLQAGDYMIEIRNGDFPAHKMSVSLKSAQVLRIEHLFSDKTSK